MEGVVEIEGANAVWMDPVAVLSSSYSSYEVSHSRYYSRSSFSNRSPTAACNDSTGKGSRKRKRKTTYTPNEKERLAELRHQESRVAILHAHSSFLATTYPAISRSIIDICGTLQGIESVDVAASDMNEAEGHDVDFLQLAEVWQAPLYELSISRTPSEIESGDNDGAEKLVSNVYQLFNTFIQQEDVEAIAECTGATFLLPRDCRFLIEAHKEAVVLFGFVEVFCTLLCEDCDSDVAQIHQLIPDNPSAGYNLVVIDPPWENKSVHRRSLYPMIPNRQLLSFPVKKLVHKGGALVALWLTNREKLHQFVEKELFPAWGVKLAATWYWLKLSSSGEMISPLDLQHHKPYECLLLGYLAGECKANGSTEEPDDIKAKVIEKGAPPDKFVVMSIPGDHSRKPPMGSLLAPYAPGPYPINGLELFARELVCGWTSWGNEPLRFQNLKCVIMKQAQRVFYNMDKWSSDGVHWTHYNKEIALESLSVWSIKVQVWRVNKEEVAFCSIFWSFMDKGILLHTKKVKFQ